MDEVRGERERIASRAAMTRALNRLDTWVTELARQESMYREIQHRPYMRIKHDLQRARNRWSDLDKAYQKATSRYLPSRDILDINRLIRDRDRARREFDALQRELDAAAQHIRHRLTLRQQRRAEPRPARLSLAQRVRNLFR